MLRRSSSYKYETAEPAPLSRNMSEVYTAPSNSIRFGLEPQPTTGLRLRRGNPVVLVLVLVGVAFSLYMLGRG